VEHASDIQQGQVHCSGNTDKPANQRRQVPVRALMLLEVVDGLQEGLGLLAGDEEGLNVVSVVL
jgi:hypothetical protein